MVLFEEHFVTLARAPVCWVVGLSFNLLPFWRSRCRPVVVGSWGPFKLPTKKYSAGSGILILVYPGNSQRISHLIKHVLLRFYYLKVITFHIFFCTRKLPSTMLKVILISWPWTTSETWLKMNTVSFIWECEATSPLRPSKVALHIWNLATWRFHLKLIGERRVTSQVLKIKVCFFKLQNKVLSTDLLLFTVGYSIMTRVACVAGAWK